MPADGADKPPAEYPRCPDCGHKAERHGKTGCLVRHRRAQSVISSIAFCPCQRIATPPETRRGASVVQEYEPDPLPPAGH